DICWGLIASFWVGNIILLILNVPLIGVWVKLLRVPYRFLVPSAVFFIAIGAYSVKSDIFAIYTVLFFGILGAVFMALDFPMAPILLGYVLEPMVEDNFRRAVQLSEGNLAIFVQRPISAFVLGLLVVVLALQAFFALKAGAGKRRSPTAPSLIED